MRIVHVSHSDKSGGADLAAYRLHRELSAIDGIDSQMCVVRKLSTEDGILSPWSKRGQWWQKAKNNLLLRLQRRLQTDPDVFHLSTNYVPNGFHRKINALKPDVVHLHWIGDNTLQIEAIPKLNAPIVWTMHDMWAFCGVEHYHLGDGSRWREGYDRVGPPTEARGLDLSRWAWHRKRRAWRDVPFTLLCPSNWMANCVQTSALLGNDCNHKVKTFHNGFDLESLKPGDKRASKLAIGVPLDRPLILFGAFAVRSFVKGGDYLMEALKTMGSQNKEVCVGVFGTDSFDFPNDINGFCLGKIDSITDLAKLYKAADLVMVPSRIDNLPSVAIESQACGCPVVAFDTAGLPDIVKHQTTGYLAAPFDVQDLIQGVDWTLSANCDGAISRNCRQHAELNFDVKHSALQHADLYRSLLT